MSSMDQILDTNYFNNQIWYEDSYAENGDTFGSALAAGDFNKDGVDDLAIGIPGEDVVNSTTSSNVKDAGMISVIYGSKYGLSSTNKQIWYQGYNGVLDSYEQDDRFGSRLAAGDFNKDGADDLAIGVSGEDFLNSTPPSVQYKIWHDPCHLWIRW